ncbi:RebB family R body protein [uncultured Tateyamaria sp.]|uniref:RebB family R body protein n=1 Tax=uncultured Tateyamaria sp. TaxID=455651 RepID=UPI002603DACF|nr:RebB family R body protein [uncultured Tateyamaria sp.]
MGNQTPLTSQITDAVAQSDVEVVGEAPAIAMGTSFQTMAHATGSLFETAVVTAQQQDAVCQAASNQGVMQLYSLDTIATAGATTKISQIGVADNLSQLLSLLRS